MPTRLYTPLSQALSSTATVRLTRIHKLDIFYTPLEERFERISRIARRAMGTHVAAVSLITRDTQWFKSVIGWRVTELPLADSLCLNVIESGQPMIVPDTLADKRFAEARIVKSGPKFRFYAGYPLTDSEGKLVGTFCVMDTLPKKVTTDLDVTLRDLGQLAERELVTADLWDAQSQLITKLGEARRQALLDTLTRVWNRRGGLELLDMMVDRATKTYEQFAVCMVDIDYFKKINDSDGHQIGDQVLRQVASSIVATVRPDDIVSRYGGDEFLIVLRDADPESARMICDRICRNLNSSPVMLRNGNFNVSLSIGAVVNDPSVSMPSATLIDRADQALYHTKQSGRNGVTLWPDDIR